MKNLNDYLSDLENRENGSCWYLVKQDAVFWKQCYYVSVLDKYLNGNREVNLENFFKAEISILNNENSDLRLSSTHRALRVADFFGLTLGDYSKYESRIISPVFKEIEKRTGGKFENTHLYNDIIQNQLEKLYVSSEIDEEHNGVRDGFDIYPALFLYKIILEIGVITGSYSVSIDEYDLFIATQQKYRNFAETILVIQQARDSSFDYSQYKHLKVKLDNRLNLALQQLEFLDFDKDKISIKAEYLSLVADKVQKFELQQKIDNNYIDYLTSYSQIQNPIKNALPKPFLILAGISGTGKSRFVRKQAEQSGGAFKLIPVRPDWHEPSELLGYKSYLGEKPTYHITEFVRFLIQAWQEIFPYITETTKGITLNPSNLEQIPPFWLCLDEMNLAPVEQYFADYLAVIETREWLWGENSVEYRCDPLIPATAFDEFGEQFGLDDKLLSFFQKFGLPLPFNLMVAGTVNMDETTHGFSRKVLDRALSFDFSEFYPNDFEQYFEPSDLPIALGYPVYSSVRKQDLQATVDSDGAKSIAFLSKLNEIFAQSPFKLGYRALNELLLSVVCFNPTNNEELQAVWDDFLMFKLLPRLEGDEDKLACDNGNVLQALLAMLPNELSEIWDNGRKDFLRKRNDESITIPCRSKAKLTWMLEKLNRLQFTTFWQ